MKALPMTSRQAQGLWLWAGGLWLGLLMIIPLAGWLRVMMVLAVLLLVGRAWRRARHEARLRRGCLVLAENACLPPPGYRLPVVLVWGDSANELFALPPTPQIALRTTGQGCFVRVPSLEQLPTLVAGLLAERGQWGEQLSVLLIINPAEHTDSAALAGQLRAFCHQVAQVRKRGIGLPLMLASYLQSAHGAGPWFSWEAGQAQPWVRESTACVSLADWQRQVADPGTRAARLQVSVQLNSAAAWLAESVLPHLAKRDGHTTVEPALACAVTLVPALAGRLSGNLWQQWLRDKLALLDSPLAQRQVDRPLIFPDPLLSVVPIRPSRSPLRGAPLIALWLFVAAAVVALASSAWQNILLARQVSDDLRRYHVIAFSERSEHPSFTQREDALATLRQSAVRLDHYYRRGAPLALGLGLYHGERLRTPLLATIAGHRQPAASTPAHVSRPVRLDSLSLFSSGSARLKPDSTKVLINALVGIQAQAGWLIVIAGHTDATGNTEHNLKLSRARAAAVHDWMQRMGDIPDSCFAVQGFGASQPIASNATEAGRSANRRVEIRLIPAAGACVFPTAGSDRQPPAATAAIEY